MFRPPLHRQRHQFVVDFAQRNKPKKVVDLGCSECVLLHRLKFHREIELLVGVDIRGEKAYSKRLRLAPLSTDYLEPRREPLQVDLYQGSVTQKDARLRGFDLVTSIELIEHLTLADVERFTAVLFGYMTPLAVIISTPNSDFNPLLRLTGFRHSDHKFEWTRAEFRTWALKACLDYSYEVEFTGVGSAPQGYQVGFCSQIAVFRRVGTRDACNLLAGHHAEDVFSYTLLYSVNYPSLHDNNIRRRVLVSEVLHCAEKLKNITMEEETEGTSGAFTTCRAQGGMELEKQHFAGGGRKRIPGACSKGRVSHDKDQESKEGIATNTENQLEQGTLKRSVSVPLELLWSCCPEVSALSGSLSNLRRILMDEPEVTLSQDSSAVIINNPDQDWFEEDSDGELDHRQHKEVCLSSHRVEVEQDWDADV